MPKITPGERSARAELALAARLREARQSRGWSHVELAREMAARGCPIDRSALAKIEAVSDDGAPRRRVSIAELVAFISLFGGTADEWLQDPDEEAAQRIERERTSAERTFFLAMGAAERAHDATAEYRGLVTDARRWFVAHPSDTQAPLEHFAKRYGDGPYFDLARRVADDVTGLTDLPPAEVWTRTHREERP